MTADTQAGPRRDSLRLVEDEVPQAPSVTGRAPDPVQTSAAPASEKPRGGRRRVLLIGAGVVALAAALWFGGNWWLNGRFIVSTDDAYVGAELAAISPRVSANVVAVSTAENRQVRAGDLLVTLDDGDQRIALESARAKSATAAASLLRIDSQIAAGRASLRQAQAQQTGAEADVTRTEADFERAQSLAAKAYGSQATLDAATAARDRAQAALASARAGVAQAEANIGVLQAQRLEAARQADELKVNEDKAERDLGFTKITAPIDGVVASINAQLGDLVGPGKRLMSIVPLDEVYIDANFKETQIGPLKIGDRAALTVDAFPDQRFEGRISGISGGTGSVFTLLPPDNATGNFTKIVQRVPVRIAIGPEDRRRHVLRPGMSVEVAIDPRPSAQR